MRRLGWACLWVLAVGCAPAWAQDPRELLNQARAAYDRGDYAAASTVYAEVLARGVDRASVHYDLGNAEFKAGRIGRAIAQYRRALKLDPQDEDIRYNLNYARGFVRQPPSRSGPLTQFSGLVLTWFSGAELARMALATYLLLAGLTAAWLWTRNRVAWLRWGAIAAAAMFLAAAGWTSLRLWLEQNQRWGVVVSAQAEARNGPNAEFSVGFVIPEGREVRILGREGNWVAVGLPSEGFKGWVQASDLVADE